MGLLYDSCRLCKAPAGTGMHMSMPCVIRREGKWLEGKHPPTILLYIPAAQRMHRCWLDCLWCACQVVDKVSGGAGGEVGGTYEHAGGNSRPAKVCYPVVA